LKHHIPESWLNEIKEWCFMFLYNSLPIITILILFAGRSIVVAAGVGRRTSVFHELGVILFGIYILLVGSITVNYVQVLQGHFERGTRYNLVPFEGIKDILSQGIKTYALFNVAGNIVLFLPLGILLPLLWRRWTLSRTTFAALLLSAGIELLQFYTGRGADIDDVMLNTLGAAIGYIVFCVFRACAPEFSKRFRVRLREQARQPAAPRRFRPAVFAVVITVSVSLTAVFLMGNINMIPSRLMRDPDATTEAGLLSVSVAPSSPRLDVGALHSRNMILLDLTTGEVLRMESANESIYPASMTKMMTVLVVLEHMDDLQEPVLLDEDIFAGIYEANASTAGFLPGEVVPAKDLLYGAMLPSGAECSIGLAEHIAGSAEAFVGMMNDKARELGMIDTHFTNPTGLHDPDHYSTAKDMAILLRHALDNNLFREILATERYSTARTNLHPDGITFYSTLFSRTETTSFPGGSILGGKTGYTDEAGQCLASIAQIGDGLYLLVTAGAYPEDFQNEQLGIEDALVIYSSLSEAT